ncbi:hypothetical protein GCM10028803_04320 [Larkinella knui]|uniref:DUF4249 domain-containing protein n=1 Tax=Larkinella knui TaxID=2025310 RepID=A0A3P1CLC8_9BACT|nr:DUF4249 domain-containing protein [Larkinella knui]RRB13886.1 DUF4249 domain-containing protein [Larkinella knui]
MRVTWQSSFSLLACLSVVAGLAGCQDVIDLTLPKGDKHLVVEAWLTDQPGPQAIRLTESADYLDNSPAIPLPDAEVTVEDDRGTRYRFVAQPDGWYVWQPAAPADTLGRIGRAYTLRIHRGAMYYEATSSLRRVPAVDSITYVYKKAGIEQTEGPREGYLAQFYARDFVGIGDCYWIKVFRNGRLYNDDTGDVILSYDGGLSPSLAVDGLTFAEPIRQAINVNKLFSPKDTLLVELHSITPEAYDFLAWVRTEGTQGGLFDPIPTNPPGNIRSLTSNTPPALGFFGTASVRKKRIVLP